VASKLDRAYALSVSFVGLHAGMRAEDTAFDEPCKEGILLSTATPLAPFPATHEREARSVTHASQGKKKTLPTSFSFSYYIDSFLSYTKPAVLTMPNQRDSPAGWGRHRKKNKPDSLVSALLRSNYTLVCRLAELTFCWTC
jgi:hypothetical protein